MDLSDKITAVHRMQAYIAAHLDSEITLEALGAAAGYSKYYAARVFGALTGRAPFAYIRALRLTRAAQALRDGGGGPVSTSPVIDTALDSGFGSHDGFTRAFAREFGLNPQEYARNTPAVRYFVPYPVAYAHIFDEEAEPMHEEKVSKIVTVTAVERPARKLILQRARSAKDGGYWAFCEEMGCDSEGLLNSIPEKFDTWALLTLPPGLVKPGTSNTAAGVEVPADYAKPIPEGCGVIDLPPCAMLYFRGMPYANEDDFCLAIGIVEEAAQAYDPAPFGWRYAPELAPRFNFGASAETGARAAVPVKAT